MEGGGGWTGENYTKSDRLHNININPRWNLDKLKEDKLHIHNA